MHKNLPHQYVHPRPVLASVRADFPIILLILETTDQDKS